MHKHKEQVYATDNFVLATCHSAYLPEGTKESVTELEGIGNVAKIVEGLEPNVSKTISIEELRRVLKMVPKEKKQIRDRECAKCVGDGWVECDMGHEHECPECGGDGYFYKKGEDTEQMAEYSALKIGDAFLAPQYVGKLVTVCEILGQESVRHIHDMDGDDGFLSAQEFQIGDVRITIMPLREKRGGTIAGYEIFYVNYE